LKLPVRPGVWTPGICSGLYLGDHTLAGLEENDDFGTNSGVLKFAAGGFPGDWAGRLSTSTTASLVTRPDDGLASMVCGI